MTQEQYKLKMKDLIDNWQQRNGTVKTVQHKQEVELLIDHTQNFICDGVVCPEKWFSQSIRPLYLLKEAYGEGSWDLIADHLCKSGQISQMWRRVSKWTSGLLGTTENTLMPYGNWGDVDHYGNEYLQKIAVVNVKKSGGKSSSNMDEIRAYAQFDREELLRELELCDPTVIVCGYTASVMDIIFKTSVRKDRNENLFYHIQLNGHDVLVLDYWHPANQYPDVMNYYGFANCKCKLDTCTVEIRSSEHRTWWEPLASIVDDAVAAGGCVNRVEELFKQFFRGSVAQLLARASVQLISGR